MASIRKVDKKWVAEIRIKDFYKSKRFDTKIAAQAWALSVEQQRGKYGGIVTGHTLGDAFTRYALEVSPKKKGGRWEEVRLKKMGKDPIADISLMQLTTQDLQDWIDRQTIAPASINREFTIIKAVIKTCCRQWKWMADDVSPHVIKPKVPRPRDRLITDDEKERILLALGYDAKKAPLIKQHEVAFAVLLALETGMRQGEIFGLEWQNIYFDKKYLRLQDSKNGYGRDVALSKSAIALLTRLNPKKSGKVFTVTQSVAEVMYRRAVKLAQINDLTFHDLRHFAVTNLAKKLNVLDLARMIGHRDIRSLMVYYNASAEDIAKRL